MGRFYIEDEVFDRGYLKKMSGNDFKILASITRHYNKHGKCFPSIRRLAKFTNLHHTTVTSCLNNLELLGFLEQLRIKERYKLLYSFSKSARFLFIETNNVVKKPDTKETIKENFKEVNKFLKEKTKTPEEQERVKQHLAEIRKKLAKKLNWPKK